MKVVERFDAFWIEEIEAAEKKLAITLDARSKIYLLHLLKRLSENRDFFYDEITENKPLGVILLEALHKELFERIRDLKIVGDLSLIFSGLYPEFLTRRLVDIDYFIQLGRKSYHLLSSTYSAYRTKQELFRLYAQLVHDFIRLTEILTEISSELHFVDESDIGKALLRWRKTRVRHYLEILKKHGIEPIG